MINFVDSLNKGLELSQQADENNKEIDAVFAELNRQLDEVYEGKVAVKRCSAESGMEKYNALATSSGLTYPDHSRADARMVIVATNPTVKMNAGKSIANWNQSATGYPCSIAFSGQKYICEDKESLELAIADLLANPFVAKTLLKVINAESTESFE
ncbi:MAG: hypothetical protein Q8N30_17350 [Methylococcales bacterium]|jgi:hypothetical protein|nr:hypothetical protein [Methylococcales bacterium]